MEIIRFVFWEAVKVLALVILGLVWSKGVAALSARKSWLKPALYALILALAGVGAWCCAYAQHAFNVSYSTSVSRIVPINYL